MSEASRNGVLKRSRHASRSSLACSRCKRAKRKCDLGQSSDGEQSCTSCRLKGEKCDVRVEDDKRRGKNKRATTGDLQSRIAGVSPPPPPPPPAPPAPPQDMMLSPPADVPAFAKPLRPSVLTSTSPNSEPFNSATMQRPKAAQRASSIVSDSSTVMDEVTARAGELKGCSSKSMHFFGATSMFYHGDQGNHQQPGDATMDDATSSWASSKAADVRFEPEPEPIVAHLLELFFSWQAPHLDVIDREAFMLHRELVEANEEFDDRAFYSLALLYAILSLASLISPDGGVRRYSACNGGHPGGTFLKKARTLLDMESERSPNLTTVQAALLVGSWYGAVGQTSLGWTYSGW